MRRSKQTAPEPPAAVQPSNVTPASSQGVDTRAQTPEGTSMSAELTSNDLERGRTTAMIATLGRVQLTLDLIERRLGRLEDSVAEIRDALAQEPEEAYAPADSYDDDASAESEIADLAGETASSSD